MRSIFKMPSDELAGDAKRRVPIPRKEELKMGNYFKWIVLDIICRGIPP